MKIHFSTALKSLQLVLRFSSLLALAPVFSYVIIKREEEKNRQRQARTQTDSRKPAILSTSEYVLPRVLLLLVCRSYYEKLFAPRSRAGVRVA